MWKTDGIRNKGERKRQPKKEKTERVDKKKIGEKGTNERRKQKCVWRKGI